MFDLPANCKDLMMFYIPNRRFPALLVSNSLQPDDSNEYRNLLAYQVSYDEISIISASWCKMFDILSFAKNIFYVSFLIQAMYPKQYHSPANSTSDYSSHWLLERIWRFGSTKQNIWFFGSVLFVWNVSE